jgi:hypothetical protein
MGRRVVPRGGRVPDESAGYRQGNTIQAGM